MKIRWLAPSRSHLIHASKPDRLSTEHKDVTTLCRNRALLEGFVEGEGVEAAADLERVWCRQCLSRLAGLPKDAYFGK